MLTFIVLYTFSLCQGLACHSVDMHALKNEEKPKMCIIYTKCAFSCTDWVYLVC